MKFVLVLLCLAGVLAINAAILRAEITTQPVDSAASGSTAVTASPSASVTGAELMLRANEEMARQNYQAALPILQKASALLSDQPDQLGPVLEEIRVCQRQLDQKTKARLAVDAAIRAQTDPSLTGSTAQPASQSVVKLIDGGKRKIHPLPTPGQTVVCTIKELGNFDYDSQNGGNIPQDVKQMDGCEIQTSGYMIPLDQAESISEFALVPSLVACCFGQPPQVQHTIVVHCPPSKAVAYFPDELTVQGTLHVKEIRDGGFIVSIFQIDAKSVRAAAQ